MTTEDQKNVLFSLLAFIDFILFVMYWEFFIYFIYVFIEFFSTLFKLSAWTITPILIIAIIASLGNKSGRFFAALILIACAVYNPSIEQFNSFIEKESNIEQNVKIIDHSDWILFSYYTVEMSSPTISSVNNLENNENPLPKKTKKNYIGVLKHFWVRNSLRMIRIKFDKNIMKLWDNRSLIVEDFLNYK